MYSIDHKQLNPCSCATRAGGASAREMLVSIHEWSTNACKCEYARAYARASYM